MNKLKYVFFSLLILVINSCDLEKMTGSENNAQPIPDSAKLFGTILDKFTEKPVKNATILVGNQATFTDENGDYSFYYYLREDEERNKPIAVRISARNYLHLDTAIVIFPQNQLSFNLEYGAPIIKRMVVIGDICQTEIFDYQGADDVVEVSGSFFYRRPGENLWSLNIRIGFNKVPIDSPKTAYFQTNVAQEIPGYGNLLNSYVIFARDRSTFADSTSNTIAGVDTFIFPPIY